MNKLPVLRHAGRLLVSILGVTGASLFVLQGAMAQPAPSVAQFQVLETEGEAEPQEPTATEQTDAAERDAREAEQPVEPEEAEGAEPELELSREEPISTPDEAPLPTFDPAYRISVQLDGQGDLTFSGTVPDEATYNLLGYLVEDAARLDPVEIAEGAPEDFARALFTGIGALRELDTGQLAFANGQWLLTGYADVDTKRSTALRRLDRMVDIDWRIMVTAPAARQVCDDQIDGFLGQNPLLFASGSARLTPGSFDLLPQVAQILALCPDDPVYVEGHTDSDGSAALNLALSISRAETVVDALIDLGVAVTRLYAVGYGETLPVATNQTVEGKRQNRRIVFNFEDIATGQPGEQ